MSETIKLGELEALVSAMTEAEQYKSLPSWNNGGMPLADFAIPGHNEGLTVEMLAVDADGIVALRRAAETLVAIAKSAYAWKHSEWEHGELAALLDAIDGVEP